MNWFTWIIFIHDRICHSKIGGNRNSLYSLDLMVNCYYYGGKRVTTR